MLYKFKSKVDGDLVMLEANGRQVLEAIGKTAGAQGIILPAEMPAAITALEAAIAQDNLERQQASAEAKAHTADNVPLQSRAKPFIDMLRRCTQAEAEVVWGV